jgi:hypothetical protein
MEVPPDDAIDVWMASEVAQQRRGGMVASAAWGIMIMILVVPLAAFTIFSAWIMVMFLKQL